jgi:hypothetical protein
MHSAPEPQQREFEPQRQFETQKQFEPQRPFEPQKQFESQRQFEPQTQFEPQIPEAPQPIERRNQWSLGDLLARASEEDDLPFPAQDDAYGMSGGYPLGVRNGGAAVTDGRIDFDMSDIAAAIDERRVMEVWQRLKRGDTEILKQRGLFSRQGHATVERVQKRYESDQTFRAIVERYLTDFENMLQDLSRTDPRGISVQSRLASDDGRVYFVLAYISGRLGG